MGRTTPSDGRQWVLSVLEQYEGRLRRFAVRLLGDEDAAGDAVQHAFVRLCDQSPDELRDHVGRWLFTVCRNKAVDMLRTRQRTTSLGETKGPISMSKEPDPAATAERKDLYDRLNGLVGGLPANQREALDLWAEGFTYREISAITSQKEGSIRVQVHRALKYLRGHPVARQLQSVGGSPGTGNVAAGRPTSEIQS